MMNESLVPPPPPPPPPSLASNAYLSSLIPNTSPDQWQSTLSFFTSLEDSQVIDSVSFPKPIVNAIQSLLNTICQSDILSAPHRLKRLEIEHECSIDTLTSKFTDAQSKISKLQADHDILFESNQNLHSQISNLNTQLHHVEEQRNVATRELSEVNLQVDSLNQRNRELLKATGHQDRLEAFQNDEYQKLLTKHTEVRTEVDKIRAESADLTVKLTSTEFAKDRAEQQLKIAQSQMEWLTDELTRVNAESTKIVKNRARQITQLINQINSLEQEKLYLDKNGTDLLTKLQSAQHELVELRAKVATLESEIQTNEQAFKHEVSRWQEYGNLQAGLAKAARDQADRRDAQVKDAKLATQIARDNLADLQRSTEDARVQFEIERQELQDKVSELHNRIEMIDKMNADLQHVAGQSATSQAFPNGSLAVTALQSGLTYSQLWAELVKRENELVHMQHRADDLEDGLVTIVKEMEDHAPVFARITNENDELRELVRGLNVQIVSAEREKSGVLAQCQIWKDRVTAVEEELDQQKVLVSDMSQQLVHLLAGMNAEDVISELHALLIESTPAQPGNQAITEHLVEFNDVQSLVAKNHELLIAVRRLAEQHDELTLKVQSNPTETLEAVTQERNNLEIQLQALRQQLHDKSMVDTEHANGHHFDASDSNDEAGDKENTVETEVRIKHQQTVIDTLQTKLNDADDRNATLTMSTARLEALNKLITDDLDRSRGTITSLRDQVQNLSAHCQSHSRTISQLEERGMVLDSELSEVRSMLEIERRNHVATQSAKEVFEQTAASVDKHLAHVTAQRDMFQGMIQEMQVMSERQSVESSNAAQAARQRIEVLEAQTVALSNKLEAARENETRLVQQYSKDLRDIHAQQVNKLINVTAAASPTQTLGSSVPVARTLQSQAGDSLTNESMMIDQTLRINDLEKDIEFLSSEVQKRDMLIEEVVQQSRTIEANLVAVHHELDTVRTALKESEARTTEAQSASEQLNANINKALADLDQITQTRDDLQIKYDDEIRKSEELNSQIMSMRTNLDKAEDRYCHELQSHASDLTLLEQIKEERLEYQTRLRQLESRLDVAETCRVTEVNGLTTTISAKNIELSELQKQIDNLRSQNEQLFNQVTDSSTNGNSNDDQLRDLLSLVRKERDALMLDRETSILESNRKLAHLERTNENLRVQLKSAEAQLEEGSKIHDLAIKLDEQTRQVALFRESNETLRNERQRLEQMYNSLCEELNSLRERVQNLRVREVDLEGELAAVRSQATKYQQDAKDWQHKCTQLPAANPIDPERYAELEARATELESVVLAKEQEALGLRMRNAELAKRNNERVALIREYVGKENSATATIEALNKAQEENGSRISSLSNEVAELNQKLSTLETEKQSIINRANKAIHAAQATASLQSNHQRQSIPAKESASPVITIPPSRAHTPPSVTMPTISHHSPAVNLQELNRSQAASPKLLSSSPLPQTNLPPSIQAPVSAPSAHPVPVPAPVMRTNEATKQITSTSISTVIESSSSPSLKRPYSSNDNAIPGDNNHLKRPRQTGANTALKLPNAHTQLEQGHAETSMSTQKVMPGMIPSIGELQACAHAELAKRRAAMSANKLLAETAQKAQISPSQNAQPTVASTIPSADPQLPTSQLTVVSEIAADPSAMPVPIVNPPEPTPISQASTSATHNSTTSSPSPTIVQPALSHDPSAPGPIGSPAQQHPSKPTPPRAMPNPPPELAIMRAKLLASKRAAGKAVPQHVKPPATSQPQSSSTLPASLPQKPTLSSSPLPANVNHGQPNAGLPINPPTQLPAPTSGKLSSMPENTPTNPNVKVAQSAGELTVADNPRSDLSVQPPTPASSSMSTEPVSSMSTEPVSSMSTASISTMGEMSMQHQSGSQFQFIPIAFNPSTDPEVPADSDLSASTQQVEPAVDTRPASVPQEPVVLVPLPVAIPPSAPVRGRRGRGRGSLPVVPRNRGGGRGF